MELIKQLDDVIFSNGQSEQYAIIESNEKYVANLTKEYIKDSFIPENLSWILNLEDRKFQFVGTTSTFEHLKNILFLHFIKLVPSCFVNSYIKSIGAFVSLNKLNDGGEHLELKLLFPMKLLDGNLYYVKQTICPKITDKQLYALQFVNIPIKLYEEEYYKVEVLEGGSLSREKTDFVKDQMEPYNFFSIEQIKTIEMIHRGMTSGEIALRLNKTKAAVYKLNRKILEKISDCFEIEFDNVRQAINFYANCYNVHRYL